MDDLHLIGIHESGQYLMLGGPDGTPRFRLEIDDMLRAALRWDRSTGSVHPADAEPARPRDVQAMIRAGATAEEVAERAGWTVEKVRRYESPILAERAHMAQVAQSAVLRSRSVTFGAPTLGERVAARLTHRDVDASQVEWDAWRSEDGQWTVEAHFSAGGRPRTAGWHFSRATMSVHAVDDEARWLSEEEPETPAVRHVVTSGRAHVYDIEADGGLRESPVAAVRPAELSGPGHAAEEERDLVSHMRQRSGARSRRRSPRKAAQAPAPTPTSLPEVPGAADVTLEHIDYDPATMPAPPSAHGHPDPDGLDGRPEPAAAGEPEEEAFLAAADDEGEAESDFADETLAAASGSGPDDEPGELEEDAFAAAAHDDAEAESDFADETLAASSGPGRAPASGDAPSNALAAPAEEPPLPLETPGPSPAAQTVPDDTAAQAEPTAPVAGPSDPRHVGSTPVPAAPRAKAPAAEAAPATSPAGDEPTASSRSADAPRRGGQRAQPTSRSRSRGRAKKARPGVPAWEDIVLGTKSSEEE